MSLPEPTMSAKDALALATKIEGWLRDQINGIGADRFVFGLSGGIDSAVLAGLCTRAVGADRVLCPILPSASIPEDAEMAHLVVDAFGVRTMTVDLTGVADSLFDAMPDEATLYRDVLRQTPPEGVDRRLQLARANVRPRTRMITNYYLANLSRGVVCGTGNKTELMIGYFTKYGDGGVDLFPLTDLYKFEIRAVASAIGVPQQIIDRKPSAGLWQGQTDEDEIGITYPVLDATLMAIESGDTSRIDPDVLARVERMIRTNEHKRVTVPMFTRSR